MSTHEHQRREEERPAPAAPPPPAEKTPQPAPADQPRSGLKYVFKIQPADPKNTFDFEDVADK